MPEIDYKLTGSFEISGRWWLPERPDEVVAGVLRHDAGQIRLSVAGCLHDRSSDWVEPKATESLVRVRRVHGITEQGKKVTLLDLLVEDSLDVHRQIVKSTYSAFFLLVGWHSDEEARFANLSFHSPYLDQFAWQQPLIVEREFQDNVLRGATVRYVRPDTISYRVPSIATEIRFAPGIRFVESSTSERVETNTIVELVPDEPQDHLWFVRTFAAFCDLLTLLTDERVWPEQTWFTPKGSNEEGCFLYRPAGGRHHAVGDIGITILLLYLGHVHDSLSSQLDRWFSADAVMKDVIYLFRDARQSGDEPVDTRFLDLAKAVEAFSRATRTSTYMAEEEYCRVVEELVRALPDNVMGDHRDSLK